MSQRISQERLSSDYLDPRLAFDLKKKNSGAFKFYVTGKHLSFSWLLVRLCIISMGRMWRSWFVYFVALRLNARILLSILQYMTYHRDFKPNFMLSLVKSLNNLY